MKENKKVYCKKCGNEISEGEKECSKCGNENTKNVNVDEAVEKINIFAQKTSSSAIEIINKVSENENVQKVASKVEETTRNVGNSDIVRDIQRKAETIKSDVANEWNRTDIIENDKKEEKFYQTLWFTVAMLVCCFPVGLFLMWKNRKFSSGKTRIIVTACVLILGIIGLNSSFGESKFTAVTNTSKVTQEGDSKINSKFVGEVEKYVKKECKYAKWRDNVDWTKGQGINLGILSKDNYDEKMKEVITTIDGMVNSNSLVNDVAPLSA